MSENELAVDGAVPTSLAELSKSLPSAYTDEKVLAEMAPARAFLPFIKMASAQAKEVTKAKICSAGDFLLIKGKDDIIKLGDKFQCVPLATRVKTCAKTADGKYLSYFDPMSKEFKETREKAKDFANGCMSGIEVLFWIPEHETFAIWYACNVTSCNEVNSIRARTGELSILKSKFIEGATYSWYGPQVLACTDAFKGPDLAVAASTIKTFNNPKSSEVEVAEEVEGGERAR